MLPRVSFILLDLGTIPGLIFFAKWTDTLRHKITLGGQGVSWRAGECPGLCIQGSTGGVLSCGLWGQWVVYQLLWGHSESEVKVTCHEHSRAAPGLAVPGRAGVCEQKQACPRPSLTWKEGPSCWHKEAGFHVG